MEGDKHPKEVERSDAFILEKCQDDYVVRPAYAVVDGTKGEFAIRNLTGNDEVNVMLFSEAGQEMARQELAARGRAVFKLSLTRRDQVIRYTVNVKGRFARGESDPVIIIDPPAN